MLPIFKLGIYKVKMFFEEKKEGVLLRIRLTPNSSLLSVKGIFTDAEGCDFLKIGVLSPPEKGKANHDLIKFLSKKLNVAKTDIKIAEGELSHYKKVLLNGNKNDILIRLGLLSEEIG
jgi:uncharacterized protein (TIGR00251 family)